MCYYGRAQGQPAARPGLLGRATALRGLAPSRSDGRTHSRESLGWESGLLGSRRGLGSGIHQRAGASSLGWSCRIPPCPWQHRPPLLGQPQSTVRLSVGSQPQEWLDCWQGDKLPSWYSFSNIPSVLVCCVFIFVSLKIFLKIPFWFPIWPNSCSRMCCLVSAY